MKKKQNDKKKTPVRKASSKEVRVLLPDDIYGVYERVAADQHITIAQVVARVAIEFVNIEKEASDSRRRVLEAIRLERLESFRPDPGEQRDSGGLAAPAAALYAEIFTQLFGFDSDRVASFFANSAEDTSLVNQKGFVFVGASKPDCRVYECFAEGDTEAVFRTSEWPADIECRSGNVRLLFSGRQFGGIPVLVEFSPGQSFAIPPNADCTLTLKPSTTMLLRSYDAVGAFGATPADFEKIASLVFDLAKREALELLPGLEKKGLIIKLDSLV